MLNGKCEGIFWEIRVKYERVSWNGKERVEKKVRVTIHERICIFQLKECILCGAVHKKCHVEYNGYNLNQSF
jgi:succinate dehydrogenase/fumarate reductase-like Fe-S protein